LNCFNSVTGVANFSVSADILGHCPSVTSAVTAPTTAWSEGNLKVPTTSGSGGHLEVSTTPGSGDHLEF
jgi:hypothetical protein